MYRGATIHITYYDIESVDYNRLLQDFKKYKNYFFLFQTCRSNCLNRIMVCVRGGEVAITPNR